MLIFELPFPEHMYEDVVYETLRRLLSPVAAPPRALSAAQEEQIVRCRANVHACYAYFAADLPADCTAAARAFAADLLAAGMLLTSSTSQARALRSLPCVALLRALSWLTHTHSRRAPPRPPPASPCWLIRRRRSSWLIRRRATPLR